MTIDLPSSRQSDVNAIGAWSCDGARISLSGPAADIFGLGRDAVEAPLGQFASTACLVNAPAVVKALEGAAAARASGGMETARRNEKKRLRLDWWPAGKGGAGVEGVVLDVTADYAARERAAMNEVFLSAVIENVLEGIIMIDEAGSVQAFNRAAERIFGYSAADVIGRNVKMLMPEPYRSEHDGYLRNHLDTGVNKIIGRGREVTGLRRDGSTFPLELGVARMEMGDRAYFVGNIRDISEKKRLESKLLQMAKTDALTGVLNRRSFDEAVEREIGRAQRYGHALCAALMDIDHFKRVNDTYGHAAGDNVLKAVSGILKDIARDTDYVARWGGEEFLVLSPETDVDGMRVFAERARAAIEAFDFPGVGRVTASFGVTCHAPPEKEDAFMKRADEALYAAKRSGRNRVESA